MIDDAAFDRPRDSPPAPDAARSRQIAPMRSSDAGAEVGEIDQGRLLASIAATSHDCILSVDTEGTVLWASPATARVLGWRPEDLAGTELGVVFPVPGRELLEEALERLGADERVDPYVDRALRRDGGLFRAEVTLGPVHGPAGEVSGITVILRDVSRGEDLARADAPGASLREVLARRSLGAAVVVDVKLRIEYAAPAVLAMLGYTAGELVGDSAFEYLHPADVPAMTAHVDRLVADPERTERVVIRLADAHRQWRWVEMSSANCLADPEVRGLVANLRDITERVQTDEALRLSEALHRAMVETAAEGIMAVSPDGAVIFANETAAEHLGEPVERLAGADVRALLGLDPARQDRHEIDYRRPGGEERVLVVSVRALHSEDGTLGSLVMVSDVTEARQAERVLRRRALHDPLTSLPNRYLFDDRLETAAARQQRAGAGQTAVLFLDVDGFKPINDEHGHEVGDELLRVVGARLADAVRGTDTVGRLGGDEFAVICEDTSEAGAMLVAHRILAAFSRDIRVGGGTHRLGISIGVALAPPYPFGALLGAADAAMYRAKQLGGHQVAVAERGGAGMVAHTS